MGVLDEHLRDVLMHPRGCPRSHAAHPCHVPHATTRCLAARAPTVWRQGSFKEEADKQRLVSPVLALYGNLLRSTDPYAVQVREHIQEQKDRFFPAHQPNSRGHIVPLFKDYVERIEARVQAELDRQWQLAEEPDEASARSLSASSRRGVFGKAKMRLRLRTSASRVADSPAIVPARVATKRPTDARDDDDVEPGGLSQGTTGPHGRMSQSQ